ncbi:N-alpha-acetyltransferase Nat5p [[Candida] railenensis]|uniref:N-alpha-acetyltransferase Nat5p n=1 Tax=[Candida] railenensis TaxID=45579 RepID=A0A9P0QJP2_9ASCO|nr:N-alpha-acetyltransferase Nat5p [[Candida] railenensis]
MPREIISLDDLTPNNVGVLKKINQVTLPTTYPESWYKDALQSDQIVKLAFYSELPVGNIKAKAIKFSSKQSFENITNTKETASSGSDSQPKILPNAVYIETLAVLASYQNLGIGSKLLSFIIEETKTRFIHEIVLHVQSSNIKAIDWYLKKGFSKKEEVKDYYKDQGMEGADADAFILSIEV